MLQGGSVCDEALAALQREDKGMGMWVGTSREKERWQPKRWAGRGARRAQELEPR